MPITALLILLIAAILHTAWNLLIKNSKDKYLATWWMVFNGGVFSLFALIFIGFPDRSIWILAFFSILVEVVYFIALSYAYQDNDFSLIYPIARGAAPAFLAIWSVLFLHEKLTIGGWLGLTLIILGLAVIGYSNLANAKTSNVHIQGITIALLVALTISVYTVIDGTAVKHSDPLPYVFAIFGFVPIPMAPFVLKRYGWERLKQSWATQGIKTTVPALLAIATYILAMMAYRIAPISYSGAVREVSVVMGAFAGWRFFGEKMGSVRLIGAVIIFTGILTIAIVG